MPTYTNTLGYCVKYSNIIINFTCSACSVAPVVSPQSTKAALKHLPLSAVICRIQVFFGNHDDVSVMEMVGCFPEHQPLSNNLIFRNFPTCENKIDAFPLNGLSEWGKSSSC